jgi:hypothetical protein
MLARAAKVPEQCGLTPIFGGVRYSDYSDLIEGTLGEKLVSGYIACFSAMLLNAVRGIPPGERLEIAFAEQLVHQGYNCIAMHALQNVSTDEMRLPDGRPKLANWRSVPKGATPLTEIGDYFAYALFQVWKDPKSLKSSLCKPILDAYGGEGFGAILTRSKVREIVGMGVMLYAIDEARRLVKKMEDQGFGAFDKAMHSILRADPKQIEAAMEAEKREREEKRKTKKQPSASDNASGDEG